MQKKSGKFIPFIRQEALRKLISQCPICNAKNSTFNIKVLDEKEDAQLTYIRCRQCGGRLMALIMANGPIVSSIGLITDLNEDDIIRFRDSGPVTEDDLLKLHENLKGRI
ncbi:hypothetical protein KKC88_02775 [Patescibacteria group bacterium]|nr:hypothetical protein [Patescibacteria group bacterium]MBU1672895.1 hypothetical protein [Patescibacteria group bacterium]MBU1963146.1 hypothetical protein [Patescibacteria group bacterium]